jgi:hypothetical protein
VCVHSLPCVCVCVSVCVCVCVCVHVHACRSLNRGHPISGEPVNCKAEAPSFVVRLFYLRVDPMSNQISKHPLTLSDCEFNCPLNDFLALFRPDIPKNVAEFCNGGRWSFFGAAAEKAATAFAEDTNLHEETASSFALQLAVAIGVMLLIVVPVGAYKAYRSRASTSTPGYIALASAKGRQEDDSGLGDDAEENFFNDQPLSRSDAVRTAGAGAGAGVQHRRLY